MSWQVGRIEMARREECGLTPPALLYHYTTAGSFLLNRGFTGSYNDNYWYLNAYVREDFSPEVSPYPPINMIGPFPTGWGTSALGGPLGPEIAVAIAVGPGGWDFFGPASYVGLEHTHWQLFNLGLNFFVEGYVEDGYAAVFQMEVWPVPYGLALPGTGAVQIYLEWSLEHLDPSGVNVFTVSADIANPAATASKAWFNGVPHAAGGRSEIVSFIGGLGPFDFGWNNHVMETFPNSLGYGIAVMRGVFCPPDIDYWRNYDWFAP